MELNAALIIPDCHRPYHHVRAYNLMLEVAQSLGESLKEILILGDFLDVYHASSHPKHPEVQKTLVEEIEDARSALDELQYLFPDTKKVYLEGNHENRIERYLVDKAPGLFGLTSIRHLLEIDQRPNFTFLDYNANQLYQVLNSKLYSRHVPPGSSAKAAAAKALCSLVYGHIHRIEESHIVGIDGTNHVAFSVGWLGDKRKDKVFGYVPYHHQWQLGFGVVFVEPSSGLFFHQKIHILESGNKLCCVFNGKIFKG